MRHLRTATGMRMLETSVPWAVSKLAIYLEHLTIVRQRFETVRGGAVTAAKRQTIAWQQR
jgi:hypothetical protein